MSKFKVGDLVKANELSNVKYNVTTLKNHCEGIVEEINDDWFSLKVTKNDIASNIGEEFWVSSRYFDLIEKFNKKEETEMNYISKIQRYIINNKAVIIFWKDGHKTIAKVDEKDKFDKEIGFMIAFQKYICFYANRIPFSKSELKKVYESLNDLKTYLFVFFNKYTFGNTVQTRKYLEKLEVSK